MPYCLKCGNKVDEAMVFCPNCGTPLKDTPQSQPAPAAKTEEHTAKQINSQKSEHSFLTFLMGGLILVTVGLFGILGLTSSVLTFGQDAVAMLVIIGVIIIGGALYVISPVRRYFHHLIIHPKKPE